MTPENVLQLGRNALEMTLILAGPVLAFGLVAGLAVSIFQALTQIHEMTLTFIPKIGATILALALFGPWMLQKMLNYTTALIESIPGLIR
ncbi:MAG TPA: flagellar biosynthesis protein FliQ [Candidatus Binatia bacterium]|jgi:flagellar biosynthetic protein FliQ